MLFNCFFPKQNRPGCNFVAPGTRRKLQLSKEDVHYIDFVWNKLLPDKQAFAQQLFFQLIMNFEQLRGVFDIDQDAVETTDVLAEHCEKFIGFWESIVETLIDRDGDIDEMTERVRDLGRRHAGLQNVQFEAKYWLRIKHLMLSDICRRMTNVQRKKCLAQVDSVNKAWSKVLGFVILEVKDAYLRYQLRALSDPNLLKIGHTARLHLSSHSFHSFQEGSHLQRQSLEVPRIGQIDGADSNGCKRSKSMSALIPVILVTEAVREPHQASDSEQTDETTDTGIVIKCDSYEDMQL